MVKKLLLISGLLGVFLFASLPNFTGAASIGAGGGGSVENNTSITGVLHSGTIDGGRTTVYYLLVDDGYRSDEPNQYNLPVSGTSYDKKTVGGTYTCAITYTTDKLNPDAANCVKYSPPSTTLHHVHGTLEHSSGKYTLKPTSPSAGNDLQIGSSSTNADWDPKANIGDTYSCDYKGTRDSPTNIKCKKGDTSPGGAVLTPSTPTDPTPTTTSAPIKAAISDITQQSTIAKTQCGAGVGNNSVYLNGILAGVPCKQPISTLPEVETIIKNIVNDIILPAGTVLFTIMIIAGGIAYITSNGNEKRAEQAKNILTAAVIGLIIMLLAYSIVFLFAKAIGGGITSS